MVGAAGGFGERGQQGRDRADRSRGRDRGNQDRRNKRNPQDQTGGRDRTQRSAAPSVPAPIEAPPEGPAPIQSAPAPVDTTTGLGTEGQRSRRRRGSLLTLGLASTAQKTLLGT